MHQTALVVSRAADDAMPFAGNLSEVANMMSSTFAAARGGRRLWMTAAGVLVLSTLPVLAQRGATPPAQVTLPPGDPVQGKALVESSKCLDCHRIGEAGSRLGPELSEIGKLRSRLVLQRAIV